MKKITQILALSSLSLLLTSCANVDTASSQTPDNVTVSGSCLRSAHPDRGSIEFYAETLDLNASKALQESKKIYQAARDAVINMKLEGQELASLENTVEEYKEWDGKKHVAKGYKARIGLRVYTTQLDKLGEVVNVVTQQGIRSVGAMQMDLSPKKLQEEQEACLESAVKNAHAKAERMAKAAGAKVGRAFFIDEQGGGVSAPPQPMMAYSKAAMDESASMDMGAPVDVKAQDITTNVRVSFELED